MIAIVVVLGLSVSACSSRPAGYGVVVWPGQEATVESGSFVELTERPESDEALQLRLPQEDRSLRLAAWRVRTFEDRDEAQNYAERFAQYAQAYGRAERRALPVREEPSNSDQTRIVYRLRDNERVKILDRSDTVADVGGLQDYWYKVLTEGGVDGWVFGYYLEVESDGSTEGGTAGTGQQDEALQVFFENTWRPIYFAEMQETGNIDLERFRSEYGLFPNEADRELLLRLPDHEKTFTYERIVSGGRSRYTFDGTSFQLVVRSDEEISIQYTVNGEGFNIAMQTIDADIAELREEERDERDARYAALRDRGPLLESNAYGTITLEANRRFGWNGYDRLVPSIIPPEAGESGRVRFDLFITEELREQYQGVISFHFGRQTGDEAIHFLYAFRSGGVRFVHVPAQNVDEKLVREEPLSPFVLFFSFRDAGGEAAAVTTESS
jgi:hypothetical protein